MPQVYDHRLQRMLDHDHSPQTSGLYLLKAGDTATGVINLVSSSAQGNNLIAAINNATSQVQAVRVSIVDAGGYYVATNVEAALQEIGNKVYNDKTYRRSFLLMGA